VFTIVATRIILIICTSPLSVCAWTIMSPFFWNADCYFFKWLPSRSRSGGMPLVTPHSATNSPFCLAMFQLISQCYRNFLDGCPSFCLKVKILFPPASPPQVHISPFYRYNLIVPHTSFSPAFHILIFFLDCTS